MSVPLNQSGINDDGRFSADRCINQHESGVFDPSADEAVVERHPSSGIPIRRGERTDGREGEEKKKNKREPMVSFWKPSELKGYEPPPNQNMVGDYHIQRGAISVLAGPPGCGKSRAALWLAFRGAQGCGEWLGFQVHCRFRTLILQNENGLARLHRDFLELPMEGNGNLDEWLRVSEPPSTGLNLVNPHFRSDLKRAIREFAPNLVVVDPWNAMTRDAMEKDFHQAFDQLRECLGESPENPACLILHHLRKPKAEDRQRGRSLGNLLAGSYTILSVPRCALILQSASDDAEDDRVVVTPAKNNDGELGRRSAWERCPGGAFVAVEDFDWDEYDQGTNTKAREPKVKREHLEQLFERGERWFPLSEAVRRLEEIAKIKRTAAYEALKMSGGRFSDLLLESEDGKKIGLANGNLDLRREEKR